MRSGGKGIEIPLFALFRKPRLLRRGDSLLHPHIAAGDVLMKRYRPTTEEIKLLMAAAMGKVPADLVVQHQRKVGKGVGPRQ